MVTFRQLEIFVSVVRHGSFRRCAEALGVSQVSISDHMKALESQLGTQLFLRTKGGPVELTEAGRRSAVLAPELLVHVHDFVHNVAVPNEHGGIIRIALHAFMMRNLGPLRELWTETEPSALDLRSDDREALSLFNAVSSGEFDVAFFYANGPTDFFSEVAGHEPLSIFVHEDHPLTRLDRVTPEMLSRTPSVSLSRDMPLRHLIDSALLHAEVQPVRHAVETDNFGLILSSLYRGMGFTCMFHASRDEITQTNGLVELPFCGNLPSLEIRYAIRRGQRSNPTILKAIKHIRNSIF